MEARRSHPVLRAFLSAPGAIGGGAFLLGLALLAVVGPIIWDPNATTMDLTNPFQVHSSQHLLGTDSLGRDVLARTLAGTRLTLELGLGAAGISAVVGFSVGTIVSTLSPRLRGLARRAIEISLSFPPILFALFLVTVIGTGARGAVIAVGLGAAPGFARLAENYATSVGSREFIASARATGLSNTRIVTTYLLPNMAEPLVLAGLAYFAGSIIDISGLDFLGLGVQPPFYDWGTLLTTGIQSIYETPFAGLAPALMITLTGMAVVYFGEALARALNPRLWSVTRERGSMTRPLRPARTAGDGMTADVPANGAGAAVLRVEDLKVSLPVPGGTRTIIRGISFELRHGEVLGIVGESGSGKTLTALAVAQLLPYPLQLEVSHLELDGLELTSLPRPRLTRVLGTGLAMIFQDPMTSMNPATRVGGQLTDGARAHRSLSRAEARLEAVKRLTEVRMGDAVKALRRYPHQFSGGMQQRIMIAMGLMTRPKVLIADEPTTALDVTVQAQVLEVLREIQKQEGMAMLLISHNLGVINQLCDRVLVMYAGRIVEEGTRQGLLENPRHPYTQALLAAIPAITGRQDGELRSIPGHAPQPGAVISGCRFAPRCPVAIDRCRREEPELTAVAANDRVACFVAVAAAAAEASR